ncbi:hypothetical protein [Kribbella sp. NPDC050470]|uniref:hypothetical protein n=1 Tax=unclassified Kribbella TaxID=2644121 RepID=UPI0037B88666
MRKSLTKGGVGLLKFGDLALQTLDFCEQSVDVFGASCLNRSDTAPVSPAAEAAI